MRGRRFGIVPIDDFDHLWKATVILDANMFGIPIHDFIFVFNTGYRMCNSGYEHGRGGILNLDDLFSQVQKYYAICPDNHMAYSVNFNKHAWCSPSVINIKYGEAVYGDDKVIITIVFTNTTNMSSTTALAFVGFLDKNYFVAAPRVEVDGDDKIISVVSLDIHLNYRNEKLYEYCKKYMVEKFKCNWEKSNTVNYDDFLMYAIQEYEKEENI